MENDDNKESQYLNLYIQKQEQLLQEYIRKSIDLEIRSMILNNAVKDISLKYEESQNQIATLNGTMDQAVKGLDALTVDKQMFKERVEQYEAKISQLEKELSETMVQKNQLGNELASIKNNVDEYKRSSEESRRELQRQTEELNNVYREMEELRAIKGSDSKKAAKKASIDEF
jgi:predicted  nucleic acid-binding Zn-ribbon protein